MTDAKNNLLMVTTAVVQAAMLFMPHDSGRVHLNGLSVRVSGGHVEVSASDGETLFRHDIPDYGGVADIDLIIPHFIVKAALGRAKKNKEHFVALDVDERFFGEVGFRPIVAQYPMFDLVAMMAMGSDRHANYNVDYLQRLQRACNLLGDGSPILPLLRYSVRCAMLELDGGSVAVIMALGT